MIVIVGARGYVGQAFQKLFRESGEPFLPLSRQQLDYTQYACLVGLLRQVRPTFLINAAGFTGKPNVDACETARAETLEGNVVLPLTISHACQATGTPWGHVSSGCIYSGAVVSTGGQRRIVADLSSPEMKQLLATNRDCVLGFTEQDEPNFSFRHAPCSFYSGSKALSEQTLADDTNLYIWRLRIPFDEMDGPRNFLSKLQRYPRVYDVANSVSHVNDFVRACWQLWQMRAPCGTYNVTNPGFITSREVIGMIERILRPSRKFEFWESEEDFYRQGALAPRSNCILDTGKLESVGITMRTAQQAIEHALENWRPEQTA